MSNYCSSQFKGETQRNSVSTPACCQSSSFSLFCCLFYIKICSFDQQLVRVGVSVKGRDFLLCIKVEKKDKKNKGLAAVAVISSLSQDKALALCQHPAALWVMSL